MSEYFDCYVDVDDPDDPDEPTFTEFLAAGIDVDEDGVVVAAPDDLDDELYPNDDIDLGYLMFGSGK